MKYKLARNMISQGTALSYKELSGTILNPTIGRKEKSWDERRDNSSAKSPKKTLTDLRYLS